VRFSEYIEDSLNEVLHFVLWMCLINGKQVDILLLTIWQIRLLEKYDQYPGVFLRRRSYFPVSLFTHRLLILPGIKNVSLVMQT
jgi:hypothetical protein